MRISDWSSDVCSSDLNLCPRASRHREHHPRSRRGASQGRADAEICRAHLQRLLVRAGARDAAGGDRPQPGKGQRHGAFEALQGQRPCRRDRKSVVSGKSVSVRVDLGGRRISKKKTQYTTTTYDNTNQDNYMMTITRIEQSIIIIRK